MIQPSHEDTMLIRSFLELPYLLTLIQINIRKITASDLKMKELFVLYLERLQDEVTKEITDIKRNMRANGLKILETWEMDDRLRAEYLCRGYKFEMMLLWSKVKVDTEIKLSELMEVDIKKINRQ
ncbi:hypothetical protein [Paenibacillus xylanexedens]|uniref:hypothetical protein n=1 Tax=Paenibacillus xylanexedens TaxID=528191 RepID=UPI0011A5D30F|nr:hypothetical protein [Paenibacillus xylanexedens]